MKKITLIITGMLAVGMTVHAQSDSSSTKSQSTYSTESQSQSQTSPYKESDRETVQSNDIPQSLRQTLGDQRYNGWENSTLYRDKASNDYYFDLKDGNSSTQYRFDKNGKAIANISSKKSSSTQKSSSTHYKKTTSTSKIKKESRNGATDGSRSGSTNDGIDAGGSTKPQKSTPQKP